MTNYQMIWNGFVSCKTKNRYNNNEDKIKDVYTLCIYFMPSER